MLAQEFASRRGMPLHKQLNNLYRLNKGFQSQNRKIKVELQQFKDELAQRNVNVLIEATIEREEPVVKRSTLAVEKTTPVKEKMLL
jgi:hypothetical protein